jgi:hypothetical protein
MRKITQEEKEIVAPVNVVEVGILRRGAHHKNAFAKKFFFTGRGRWSLSVSVFSTLKRRFGFGPKRTSPSSLFSSPDLGPRAREPPPPTVSPLLPPSLPVSLPGRDRTSASASSTPNPHSFPDQQIRPICGPLPAEIRDKAAVFFSFFLSLPRPRFPF